MTITTEFKKALYKEKPTASLALDAEEALVYTASCSMGTASFFIPKKDIGETVFKEKEPAQLLIRWLVNKR